MANERLTKVIAEVQRRQSDPAALEAGINVLSRTLLFSGIDPQAQAEGYKFLRGFTGHQDAKINELVGEAFDNRWRKVGFYDYWEASSDDTFSLSKRDRGTYHGERLGRAISTEAQVTILELAKAFQAEPGKPIPVRRLDERLFAMLGPGNDADQILQELSRKYVLTDDMEFVPLLEVQKGRVRVATSAFNYLMPHIPALEAISAPENVIPDENVRTIRRVQATLGNTFESVKKHHANGVWEGITVREDDEPLMFSFAPDISSVDYELDREKEKSEYEITSREDEAVYVDSRGRLHSVSHYQTFSGTRPSSEGSLTISAYEQPPGARGQILVDFWGKIIKGKPLGYTRMTKDRGKATIHAEDAFKPALPEGLASAEEVEINEDGLKLIWQDISGVLEPGRYRFAMLEFRTPFAVRNPHSRDWARPAYHVSGQVDRLTISRTNPEYRKPKAKNEGDEEDEILGMGLRQPRTTEQEIKFDRPTASMMIPHPEGGYSLRYKVGEEAIDVVFKGKGWERQLVIPRDLDVVAIAQSMARRINAGVNTIIRDREVIAHQVADTRRLGLVEFAAFRRLEHVPQSDLWKYLFDQLVEEQKGGDYDLIDQEMSKLDPKTQGIARSYMRALSHWHHQDHADVPVKVEEDPRQKIRFMVRKHELPLSEEFLKLVEKVFIH